jgi:hypothetical protein
MSLQCRAEFTVILFLALGVFQQAVSGLSWTNQSCYELADGCFTTFGFEYKPG